MLRDIRRLLFVLWVCYLRPRWMVARRFRRLDAADGIAPARGPRLGRALTIHLSGLFGSSVLDEIGTVGGFLAGGRAGAGIGRAAAFHAGARAEGGRDGATHSGAGLHAERERRIRRALSELYSVLR